MYDRMCGCARVPVCERTLVITYMCAHVVMTERVGVRVYLCACVHLCVGVLRAQCQRPAETDTKSDQHEGEAHPLVETKQTRAYTNTATQLPQLTW